MGKSLIRNEIFKLIIETNRLSQAAITTPTILRGVGIVDMRTPPLVTMIIVNAVEMILEIVLMIVKEIERVITTEKEKKRVHLLTNLTGKEIAREIKTMTSMKKTIKALTSMIKNGQKKKDLITKITWENLRVFAKTNAMSCTKNLIRVVTKLSANGITKVQ